MGYSWNNMTARASPPVRWQADRTSAGDEAGSGYDQHGSLYAAGLEFDVTAHGSDTLVRSLSIDVDDAIATEALLDVLRAGGAEISFAGDDESAMFYYVSVPGRETAQLEARRVCTPYGSRAARHCRSVMTLNFEPD